MSKELTAAYEPLPQHADGSAGLALDACASRRRRRCLVYSLALNAVQLVAGAVLVSWVLSSRQAREAVFPQGLYSPAQGALEFVPKVFTMGFSDPTIYQGDPSPEVDKAWTDLYNTIGVSRISKDQARLLPNKTSAIPGDEDGYIVGLEVFHQLHCLNFIRKGFYKEYYTDNTTGKIAGVSAEHWPSHLSHCIDNIRQALMCASDVSLVIWQWSETAQKAIIRQDNVHSCRNFDKVVEWAEEHELQGHFDDTVHIVDDIEIDNFRI